MVSLEELNQIKLNYKPPRAIKIVVRMGICGISVGAKEVLKAFEEQVEAKELKDVVVTTTGCIGLCSHEPIVEVVKPGMPDTTYVLVTPEKAKAIFFQHVLKGRIINEWVVPEI